MIRDSRQRIRAVHQIPGTSSSDPVSVGSYSAVPQQGGSYVSRWILSLLIITALLVPNVFAQGRGVLAGRVIDANTKTALEGANIVVKGTPYGGATDETGMFRIFNIPQGNYEVEAYFIGYDTVTEQANIVPGSTTQLEFDLVSTILEGGLVVVTANRAVERETPVAFSNVGRDKMDQQYTTQDVPGLLNEVPGVFTSSTGLGEGDLYIRGFDSERVQILINGIPVNDPESQVVYWSNWTGLSSNATSIQVQRGSGSSLYGSGAFGGSVNIETMGVSARPGLVFRTSAGMYTTQGAASGDNEGKIADGDGGFEDYSPMNYMVSARYNSGLVHDDKLMYSASIERKGGDSYLIATNYDGWSFGFDAKALLDKHILTFSFIGAPQKHNQAYADQDLALLDQLGREYNRTNHEYQENYYFKPQFSLRHDWVMSESANLSSNFFMTFGKGGGKYLRNDNFDVTTGEVGFKSLSESTDNKYFGRNAWWIYQTTGGEVVLDGFNPADTTFNGESISYPNPLIPASYNHSWWNDSQNNHTQFGLNTVYTRTFGPMVKAYFGGELRRWVADHFAESFDFRSSDAAGNLIEYDEVQRRYDYTTTVTNVSGFARLQLQPMEDITVVADGQYASYNSKVEENDIQIFDFEAGRFLDRYFKASMDQRDDDGNFLYEESDYERTYDFFSPKFGINYNVTDKINALVNYSISYKEPKTGDWYNRDDGPDTDQDLDPEKSANIEFGVGYRTANMAVDANYYILNFEDKIESITDQGGNRETINAGKAKHQGLELMASGFMGPVDMSGSLTLAQNRWEKIDVQEIFSEAADDIVDKVVPFSPEKMASASAGYTMGPLRLGLSTRWFDDYYASYTNTYTLIDGTEVDAKLDAFFELNADITYDLRVMDRDVKLRLDLNNITNNENYARAQWKADYNRNDDLLGDYYMYVASAPLFNVFLTAEINF